MGKGTQQSPTQQQQPPATIAALMVTPDASGTADREPVPRAEVHVTPPSVALVAEQPGRDAPDGTNVRPPSDDAPNAPPAAQICWLELCPQVQHARVATEQESWALPSVLFAGGHLRALATVDGRRCVAVADTGADISVVSQNFLLPGKNYNTWDEDTVTLKGVGGASVEVIGRVALEVDIGPVHTLAPFMVVVATNLQVTLGTHRIPRSPPEFPDCQPPQRAQLLHIRR